METPHRGNVSPRKCLKKRTHKTILMSYSINSKLKRLYILKIFTEMAAALGPLACPSRSARPPSLS